MAEQIDVEESIAKLGIKPGQFSLHTGISTEALMNHSDEEAYSRCTDIFAILNKIRPWFDSDSECWLWYIGQPISGYGNASAAEVVKSYNVKGIEAVNNYIDSKKLGGFE